MAYNNYENTYLSLLPNDLQYYISDIITKSNFNLVLKDLKKEINTNSLNVKNLTKYDLLIRKILFYYKYEYYATIPYIDLSIWLNHNYDILSFDRKRRLRDIINELSPDLYVNINKFKNSKYFARLKVVLCNITYLELLDFYLFIISN